MIHGTVHDDSFPVKPRNYAAGIEYLKTGDEKAKALVTNKRHKYVKVPNVTRFVGESSGL